MKKPRQQLEEVPNIVAEYKIGNTVIKVADNYCRDKTPEDIQRILDRIAANVVEYRIAQAAKKAREAKAQE